MRHSARPVVKEKVLRVVSGFVTRYVKVRAQPMGLSQGGIREFDRGYVSGA